MLKSYEAIYHYGQILWLGEKPNCKRIRVLVVADDSQELEEDQLTTVTKPNSIRLVEILQATPQEISISIIEKFGDPVAWQRQQRLDREQP